MGEGGAKDATASAKDTSLRRPSGKMQPVDVLRRVLLALLVITVAPSILGKLQPGECAPTNASHVFAGNGDATTQTSIKNDYARRAIFMHFIVMNVPGVFSRFGDCFEYRKKKKRREEGKFAHRVTLAFPGGANFLKIP